MVEGHGGEAWLTGMVKEHGSGAWLRLVYPCKFCCDFLVNECILLQL